MKIQTIQQRLREAREKTGGRYVFHIEEDGEQTVGILHYARPNPWGYENCPFAVEGDVADCLEALAQYITKPGLIPVRPTMAAAE